MTQHKHLSRHFLTGIMVLMAGLGAQGVRADALAEASAGVNDAPLSCSGTLSSSIGAETLYFCQGALSIGKGTLSASQSIKITADGDITLTDVNAITPRLIVESGQTVTLSGGLTGLGELVIFAQGPALDPAQAITPASMLDITRPVSQGTVLVRDNSDNTFGGAVGLVNSGALVISNPGGIHLGTTDIAGQLVITAAGGTLQNAGQWSITGATTFEAVSNIPEPGTWALMGMGLAGIAATARRHRRRA